MATTVGVLEIQMMADMARLSNDLKRANNEITSAVRGFNNILNTLGVGISFAFFADLMRRSNEFEHALAKISTQIDDTTGEIERLSASSKNFAAQYGTAQAEQANAYYEIISAGIEDTAKATEILNTANKLAVGGMTTLGVSVDGLTNIMNSYAGKVESADAVSDALFIGMKAGKATMEELSSGLGKVTPLAATLNVAFDELVAVIATLSKQGIQTSESITGVRAILSAVAKPSSEAAKLSRELGLEFNAASLQAQGFAGFIEDVIEKTGGSTTALSTLFGRVEALVPVLSLAGAGGQDFSNILDQMNSKAGATQEAFEKMAASPGFKVDRLMTAISNAAITLGAKLSDVLTPAIVKVTQAFNNLFLTQEQSPLEKQIALISSLEKKLASELDKKHIPLGDIFLFDKRKADLYEQQLEDAREDLLKLQKAQESVATSSGNLKTEIEKLTGSEGGSSSGVSGLGKSVDKTKQKIDSFLESIRKQAAEAGKTANEIKRMEAAQLGVLDSVEPYLRIIEAQAIAEEDLRISRQKQADDLRRIEQLTKSTRTQQEVFNDTVRELDVLLEKGLGMEAYNRALKDARDQLAKTEKSTIDKSREFWDTNEQIWIQGVRNVQTSLANGLFNVFDDGLNGMVSGVKRAVGQMIAEFASIKILQSTGIAGILGMGSTAAMASGGSGGLSAMNMASLGSSAMNLMSSGFGMTPMIGNAALQLGQMTGITSLTNFGAGAINPALASFVTEGAGGLAASAGSAFAAAAGPAMVAFIATQGLKVLAGDKRLGGGFGKALNTVGDIPIIGDMLPIVPILNGLFGRGAPKFQGESLVGSVSSGGFEGVLNQSYREKGGLARSDRVSNFIVDSDTGNLLNQFGRLSESGNIPGSLRNSVTDPAVKRALEVGDFLDEAFGAIGNTLQQTADKLGISSDALNGFSASLDLVSAKGEALSDAQISDEITRISDAMIATLIPNLDDLAKKGETSADTLTRLNSQFSVLESAAMLFGNTAEQAAEKVKALGLDGQTAFIESLGGVQVAATEIQEFYDTVFTDAQKLEVTKNQILDVLKPLGVDFVPTMEQLYDAVASGNPQLIQAVLKVDGLVSEFDRLNTSLTDVVDPIKEIASTTEELSGEMRALAAERRAFTAGRREAQEGLGGRGEVATTINGRIYTETEIRAMQQSSVDLAAESASALIKEQLSRAGGDSELIKNLNATLEFIKFQSGQRNAIETAARLNDDELAKQAAAQLGALNAASRTQRGTTFNGSVRFPDPPGWNESADNAEKQRMSYFDVIKSQMAEPAIAVGTAFNDLRSAALKLADDLLLGDKSILSVFQKTGEAQRQYDDMISRARLGDATSSELSSGVNNLLDAQLNSASTKFEFDRQFATVVNDLRSIGQTTEDRRLAEQKKSTEELKAEIKQLREDLNAANVAIAKSTAKTADVLDRWSVVGLPATEA
ncbi:MAG: phage tail tape measure protein [Nitrosomonas sp.]|nr:phage tail tape measure protein [Nitrosomonas sp.]